MYITFHYTDDLFHRRKHLLVEYIPSPSTLQLVVHVEGMIALALNAMAFKECGSVPFITKTSSQAHKRLVFPEKVFSYHCFLSSRLTLWLWWLTWPI